MGVSYWLEEPAEPFAQRRLEGAVDVAVIGGGVTGCSCALTLASAGLRVRVHEAREIASGASGRNGGFGLRGGAMPYDRAREQLGRERARSYWRLTGRYVERLALRAEYEALVEDGFEAEWVDELEGSARELFAAALFHPGDGSLAPARSTRRLAQRAAEAGAELREHERVGSLDELDADLVVVATDGYTDGLVTGLDAAVKPVRNQVIVTEPLAKRLYECPSYGRYGYDYWQQLQDGRLVVGGRRDADIDAENTGEEALTPAVQESLQRLTRELVGTLPAITHRWSGIFGVTADRVPLAGRLPGQERVWVAAGYSGHGNVLGLACGDLVARAILGEPAPELDLFDPARVL